MQHPRLLLILYYQNHNKRNMSSKKGQTNANRWQRTALQMQEIAVKKM